MICKACSVDSHDNCSARIIVAVNAPCDCPVCWGSDGSVKFYNRVFNMVKEKTNIKRFVTYVDNEKNLEIVLQALKNRFPQRTLHTQSMVLEVDQRSVTAVFVEVEEDSHVARHMSFWCEGYLKGLNEKAN